MKLFIPILRSFIHRANETDFMTGEPLKGFAFPTNKVLAQVSDHSESQIKRIKRVFKKMKLMNISRRQGTSSLYQVVDYEKILRDLENGKDFKQLFNRYYDEITNNKKEDELTEAERLHKKKSVKYLKGQQEDWLLEDVGVDPDDYFHARNVNGSG